MAYQLSTSPSGRRLSELLEERQEPFFLDLHLLEKGCSGRLLNGYDTAMCWPAAAAGNDAAAVLKRLTSKKKKKNAAAGTRGNKRQQQQPAAGSGLLRLMLSKILHGKAANQKPAALQCSESFNFNRVAPSPLPCSKHLDAIKLRADAEVVGHQETEYYSDSDEYDDEKQQSPVSVLEHPFESSAVHSRGKCSGVQDSPKNAMAIVRALLMETAYTPEVHTQLFAKCEEDILSDTNNLVDHDGDDYYHGTSPKNFHEDDETEAAASPAASAAYWATHRAELARVSELVSSEVPKSRLDGADVQPERREVCADVETALLDALLLELVMDLGCC